MRHRQLLALTGSQATTRAEAEACVQDLPTDRVLWIASGIDRAEPHLGSELDAVVLDLHGGLDLDLLGQIHGLVRGGGLLVLRLPTEPPDHPHLRPPPYTADQLGQRTWARLLRAIHSVAPAPPLPVGPPSALDTREQDALVDSLVRAWSGADPSCTIVLARRGRGKSAALGRALSRSGRALDAGTRIVAPTEAGAATLIRFAGGGVRCLPRVLLHEADVETILVDEAAQLSVAMLQAIVRAHPHAHLVFATTVEGYEGTGRGFVLRFLPWLSRERPEALTLRMRTPIRWSEEDPVEAMIDAVSAAQAAPARLRGPGPIAHRRLDVATDDRLLDQVFGLLIQAHYRTTPSDLHRLLDAPNLVLHTLMEGDDVVAVGLLAREGGLDAELCERLGRGRERIRGHALADTLISHTSHAEAGTWRMLRSVRTAVHPERRRRGLGARLVRAIHAEHADEVELFGTVFSATPEVVRWRHRLGYRLVRVGVAPSHRSGEPTAVMVRPVEADCVAWLDAARAELARELPAQLQQLGTDAGLPLDPSLIDALQADLPRVTPRPAELRDRLVQACLEGPRPLDSTLGPLRAWLEEVGLDGVEPSTRAMIEARLRGQPWPELASAQGMRVRAAMRQVRRALRTRWRQTRDGDGVVIL